MFEEFKHPDVTIRDGDSWEQWKITGDNEIMAVCYMPHNYPQLTVFTHSYYYFIKQYHMLIKEKETIEISERFESIIFPTRRGIYDKMCALLTDYEHRDSENIVTADDLYSMLVDIQNAWEATITKQD